MGILGRSCTVCGRRTDGKSRCAAHRVSNGRASSCVTCGAPCTGNYCDEHQPVQGPRKGQEWRAAYNDPEYRKNRRLALKRDGWCCQVCGRGKVDGVRLEVDHVIAVVDGGTNGVENLIVLCQQHHQEKTNRDRARRARRP